MKATALATLSLSIIEDSSEARYLQLTRQFKTLISTGRINPGDKLPSSRKLAELLNVSRTTTLTAYNQLIAEGIFVTLRGSGTFISDHCSAVLSADPDHELPGSSIETRLATEEEAKTEIKYFDSGPDVTQFPVKDWTRSFTNAWRNPAYSLFTDYPPGGFLPLRIAIANMLKVMRNVDCQPEQIIITAGSRDNLSIIAKALALKNKTATIENPCFSQLRNGLSEQVRTINHCSLDHRGAIPPQAFSNLCWITPARQYPTGITMPLERRIAWLNWAKQHQSWLVEDDYDAEFNYEQTPPATLFNLSQTTMADPRVIFSGSFSKLMFRTLRVGYLVVPETLIAPVLQAQQAIGNLASMPIQPALAEFLVNRRFFIYLRRMRRIYQQRRDFLLALIAQELDHWLDVEKPPGGMHVFARLKIDGVNHDDHSTLRALEQQIRKKLPDYGLTLDTLSEHYVSNHQYGLLLGFSGNSIERLKEGVMLLKNLLQDTVPAQSS